MIISLDRDPSCVHPLNTHNPNFAITEFANVPAPDSVKYQ